MLRFPFLLSASTKTELVQIDAEAQMKQQIENAIVLSVFTGVQQSPYFVLSVRRELIVEDTLHQVQRAVCTVGSHMARYRSATRRRST